MRMRQPDSILESKLSEYGKSGHMVPKQKPQLSEKEELWVSFRAMRRVAQMPQCVSEAVWFAGYRAGDFTIVKIFRVRDVNLSLTKKSLKNRSASVISDGNDLVTWS